MSEKEGGLMSKSKKSGIVKSFAGQACRLALVALLIATLASGSAFMPLNANGVYASALGNYDPEDIAAVNRIIENNGLPWTKAPADGSYTPFDWGEGVATRWSYENGRKRLKKLSISNYYNNYPRGDLRLTGLDALEELDAFYSRLDTLDVSGLASLKRLDCRGDMHNSVSTLKVSGNASLEYIYCEMSMLTALDVSGLDSLKELDCRKSALTALDVSGLDSLKELDCSETPISTLNV
jgi:hypothetical protein